MLSVQKLYQGAWTGRFISLEQGFRPGQELIPLVHSFVWNEGRPLVERDMAFCSGSLPHLGDLDRDSEPLSYKVAPTGVVCMWCREETRKVQKKGLDIEASRIAMERYITPLDRLVGHEAESCRSQALSRVLSRLPPTVKIHDLIGLQSMLWAGRRNSEPDLVNLLSEAFGPCHVDPMIWPPESSWKDSVSKLLSMISDEGCLEEGVDVVEASFETSGFSWSGKTSGLPGRNAIFVKDLRGAIERCGLEGCRSMSCKVWGAGEGTVIGIDPEGVFRGEPPPSRGGLPSERIARRMRDIRDAAWRVARLVD